MKKMKRHQFRAWDLENEVMRYSHEYASLEDFFSIHEHENSILMQFTGWIDRRGLLVYEKDWVRHERLIISPVNPVTGEPLFQDVKYIRIGRISITPSMGVTVNGIQKAIDYNDGKLVSERKYNGNPAMFQEFADVIGNLFEDGKKLEDLDNVQ